MKKLLCLIVFSLAFTVNAKQKDLKSVLVANEWRLNCIETFSFNYAFPEKSKIELHEVITGFFNLKFNFDAKNNLSIRCFEIPVFSGVYSINREKLVFINDIKKEKTVFKIISQDPDKIVIRSEEHNFDLVLNAIKNQFNLKSILTNNDWKLDVEAMNLYLNLKIKMGTLPQMQMMSEEEREIALKSTIASFEGMRYHFQEDNVIDYKIVVKDEIFYRIKGTFSINNQEDTLIIDTKDEPNKSYKVLKVENEKITLIQNDNNMEIILIPVE